MTPKNDAPITLPALRGVMGNWVYYCCLMSLNEIAQRVNYAEEIHKNEHLSDMIQRTLKKDRATTIASYLKTEERFFNSLVIATYRGQPNWFELSSLTPKNQGKELGVVEEETVASVGFLKLQGDERLFALDGQHRLAGIKKAIEAGLKQDPADEISVIFVSHEANKKGLERTRRLFTTLNKTARPVSKGDIIALDEDDVMAICVRRLIEDSKFFKDKRVAFVASNNMPVGNLESLTTIGNLYDLLALLFSSVKSPLRTAKAELQRVRPNDEQLEKFFNFAKEYFELLGEHFSELGAFFSASNCATVVKKHRGGDGGKITFRPIGLDVLTKVIARLSETNTLKEAVVLASKLPRDLERPPYTGLMWDVGKKTISNAHLATLREVMLHMVGGKTKWKQDTLLERYRRETGNDSAKLPAKVV